jgi:hypothetical protein
MAIERLVVTPEEEEVIRAVLASLRRIQYGSVQIAVQDGRVVQIDTLEKQRFNTGASNASFARDKMHKSA